MVRWDRRQFGRGAVWQPQAWEEIKMFKVIRDGKVQEFSELHEMQKYINRSKRWGGEYVFTFDMLNIEEETWKISSTQAWEDICWMAERNGDIKVLVEYPEIETKTTEEVQTEDVEKAATDTQQDDFVKHFGVYTPTILHFEMAGMEVAYDSTEPCEWFGGRNDGVNCNSLKTGFHEVMYFVGRKTINSRLIYRTRDCYTGSFTVGAGNNAKAWRVDRRNPRQVFHVLEKIKAWLTEHGELAA